MVTVIIPYTDQTQKVIFTPFPSPEGGVAAAYPWDRGRAITELDESLRAGTTQEGPRRSLLCNPQTNYPTLVPGYTLLYEKQKVISDLVWLTG